MIGVDYVWQTIVAKDNDEKIAEGNELSMTHIEGAAVGQIESKRSKPVARKFAQVVDVHRRPI